jgi:hypothetical protein
MTIEITRSPGTPAASDTTVLITEAQVAFGTAAATAARGKERWWVPVLSRIFSTPRKSRPERRPHRSSTAYLERARMAREMERP